MTPKYLPRHATLVHPLTGQPLEAIGYRRDGSPIWPVMGGSQPAGEPPANPPADPAPAPKPGPPPTPAPAPPANPAPPTDPKPEDALGDAGKRALAAERDARKAAEDAKKAADQSVADLTAQLAKFAPLQKLADALGAGDGDKGKTDIELIGERLAANEKALADQKAETDKERLLRLRAEVAQEKGLTKAQAARLRGATAEELAADADELLTLFPAPTSPPATPPPASDPKNTPPPKPDPSQGARGDAPTRSTSLSAALTAAMKPPA